MKKSFLFVILIFLAGHFLMAQPACVKDVIYSLVSLKEVPKARKMMEEQCFPGNESSADVWLVRANVFIQLYEYELERKSKDAKYVIRWPDAIIIANESFYKAIELNKDIKTPSGLFGPGDGQLLSAAPIHDMALDALDKKDYNEAIRLLNMVIRSYRVDPIGYADYLPYVYIDLANCYKAMGDDDNYKKILLDAAKLNLKLPHIYLNLYDLYKQENDTVKCGEILTQARKVIPDSLSINVKASELDYFAMLGDSTKLVNAAIKMFEQYKNNTEVINMVAGHLVNNKVYLLAEEIIKSGLAIAPDDFDLNQQMTYRYFYEAIDYDAIVNELKRLKKFIPAQEALEKFNEILGVAVVWAEKAYNVFKNDVQHNKMYGQILVRLVMPVPADLQEKLDSYRKQ